MLFLPFLRTLCVLALCTDAVKRTQEARETVPSPENVGVATPVADEVAAFDAARIAAAAQVLRFTKASAAPAGLAQASEKAEELVRAARTAVDSVARRQVPTFVFGLILLLLAIPVQWLNELRSARAAALLARGLDECLSVGPCPDPSNRGRLIHVQGSARGVVPIADNRFEDAVVVGSLRLQSTLEVLEWVPTSAAPDPRAKESTQAPRFRQEWTTTHHDSLRFRKPSPENPKLSFGVILGTTTKPCTRVELGSEFGAFLLVEGMLSQFHKFESVMEHLPQTVHLGALAFVANPSDGYYYARPGMPSSRVPAPSLFSEPNVGDLRVRFLHVPGSEATAVGVQCQRGDDESFVPYRLIARGPCLSEEAERERQVEAGLKSRQDYQLSEPCSCSNVEEACLPVRLLSCFCCPWTSLASLCTHETVTEEIMYVSDQHDPPNKPFEDAVRRSPWKVLVLRVFGWGLMWLGVWGSLGHVVAFANTLAGSAKGPAPDSTGMTVVATLVASAFVFTVASWPYRGPLWTLQSLCFFGFLPATPLPCGCEKRSKACAA